MNYPFLVTTEVFGSLIEIIVGFIFVYSIQSFNPTPGEFALIIIICTYGIISGIIRISPYVDEAANGIITRSRFFIKGYLNKKK